jgi:hypothetical protein
MVPPGEHRVAFRFRSRPLRTGVCMSLLAVALLVVVPRAVDRKR